MSIQKIITLTRSTAQEVTLGETRPGKFFIFKNKPAFEGSQVPIIADISEIFRASKLSGSYRKVFKADGSEALVLSTESIFVIDQTYTSELQGAFEAFEEQCKNVENINKLPKIKTLLDELNIGYALELDESMPWGLKISISEKSWKGEISAETNFYTLEGSYGLNTSAWELDSLLSNLQRMKEDRDAESARVRTIQEKWNSLTGDMKELLREANKLGLN